MPPIAASTAPTVTTKLVMGSDRYADLTNLNQAAFITVILLPFGSYYLKTYTVPDSPELLIFTSAAIIICVSTSIL